MKSNESTVEAVRWGLPSLQEIKKLGDRLKAFYDKFRPHLRTKTRDTSDYGLAYVSGLLCMESERNMAAIGRRSGISPQNMQHFVSNSSWSRAAVIQAIQEDVSRHPEFQSEAVLVLDESAEQKSGQHSAGAGRQHNGRLGKVEMSQVGVFLSLVTPRVNTWIDGELFLQERWFTPAYSQLRQETGIPESQSFQTKPEKGWEMIRRAQRNGVPFVALAMDDLYGRNKKLRFELDQARIEYYGDVPANTIVYLDKPERVYPLTKRGKPSKRPRLQARQRCQVQDLLDRSDLERAILTLRPHERGELRAEFARCRVWTVYEAEVRQEWLLIRRDADRVTYVLSNAAADSSLEQMAWRKSHRYFIERSNQDAKGELGWDEFQGLKYQAWEHHLALTILASWFVAETRLDWMSRFAQDPALLAQYEVEVLPLLSVSNVRELMRAAMPLPQLSPQDATALVAEHLINRTRSRKSRLRRQKVP
jgi:SRSO17 transposase